MPVLVTCAHRPLERRIALRLLEEGGEVRAYASGDTSVLRAAGAVVATGEVDDEGRLEAAMEQVHTVVHVGGGLHSTDAEAIVRDARVVATAAANAGVRRVIALSLPGADPASPDPLRRAKGMSERTFAEAAPPSVVVRVSLVDTPSLRDTLATSGLGRRLADVEVAPVRAEDLVELVVGFDRARSQATEGHLVVAADGPRRLPLGEHLRAVGVASVGAGGLVGRRLVDESSVPLLASALRAGPWWTQDETVLDGWRFCELDPREPTPEAT
jgi:uncharacterized protein YbjT (DUF2867 family)